MGLTLEEVELLAPLSLRDHIDALRRSDMEAYRQGLESQAKALQTRKVDETQVVLSLGLYLESCVPYLSGRNSEGRDALMGIVRLLHGAELTVLQSYADYRTLSLRRLQERERRNLSRDLHDDIGHNLLVLKLYLEMMNLDLQKAAPDPEKLKPKLEEALALASYTVASVKRLMLDLGPPILSQFGLLGAIRIYANQFSSRTGIAVKVEASDLPVKLADGQETALYRVLQGALSNVLQHASAKNAKITVGATKKFLVMSIEDDGIGFDVTSTIPQKAFGIMAMRERVELLDGKFYIESRPRRLHPRKHGTRIEIDLPLSGDSS
jgi:signal transduction histidine kinase